MVNAAIIGQCDLLQPYDVVERELKEHMRFKNFRGIRFLVSHDPEQRPHTTNHVSEPDAYRNPTLQKNLELFAKYNLSFDLWCYAHQLPGAIELVKLHPNVNFVLDVGAFPFPSYIPPTNPRSLTALRIPHPRRLQSINLRALASGHHLPLAASQRLR